MIDKAKGFASDYVVRVLGWIKVGNASDFREVICASFVHIPDWIAEDGFYYVTRLTEGQKCIL